jgi:hypothetical protein
MLTIIGTQYQSTDHYCLRNVHAYEKVNCLLEGGTVRQTQLRQKACKIGRAIH